MFNLKKTPISGPGSLSHHSFPISSLSTYLEMIKQAVFLGRGGHSLHAFNVNNDWYIYQKQLWPFPATLKQRYASLGLFSWCASYCCLFVTILSPLQLSRSTNWWIYPTKLVVVPLLWCWLIWWLYWPIDSNLKKFTGCGRNSNILILMRVHENKPCAAVQFPHSGPEQVSWMKNSLFLRAMSRKKLVGNHEMGLNYVDFYWLSQKSLIEIKMACRDPFQMI